MRCLSFDQCAAWGEAHGYPILKADAYGKPRPDLQHTFRELRLEYPVDSGAKIQFARTVLTHLCSDGEVLLWMRSWAVFPASSHMPLFTRFREAIGEARPLIEAPGHLVTCDERDDAISLLAMALLFFWDCYVLPVKQRHVFLCSHDESCAFWLPDRDTPSWLQEAFGGVLDPGGKEE